MLKRALGLLAIAGVAGVAGYYIGQDTAPPPAGWVDYSEMPAGLRAAHADPFYIANRIANYDDTRGLSWAINRELYHRPTAPLPDSIPVSAATQSLKEMLEGGRAPDRPFLAADGATHTLEEFADRWVLVDLWAVWCPPCLTALPGLDRLAAREDETGLKVVLLHADFHFEEGSIEEIEEVFARRGVQHLEPYLMTPEDAWTSFEQLGHQVRQPKLGEDGEIESAAPVFPTTVLLAPGGEPVGVWYQDPWGGPIVDRPAFWGSDESVAFFNALAEAWAREKAS